MAYSPTTWQDGDTITSARLNKMEQGIAGAGGALVADLVVTADSASQGTRSGTKSSDGYIYTLNKTAQEVLDALEGGMSITVRMVDMVESDEGTVFGYTTYVAVELSLNEDPFMMKVYWSDGEYIIGTYDPVNYPYPSSEVPGGTIVDY